MSKGNTPSPATKEMRQKEALARNTAWEKLGPAKQLEQLDNRLGKGVGAAKQRARLKALLEKKPAPKPEAKADNGGSSAKERRAAEQAKRPSK